MAGDLQLPPWLAQSNTDLMPRAMVAGAQVGNAIADNKRMAQAAQQNAALAKQKQVQEAIRYQGFQDYQRDISNGVYVGEALKKHGAKMYFGETVFPQMLNAMERNAEAIRNHQQIEGIRKLAEENNKATQERLREKLDFDKIIGQQNIEIKQGQLDATIARDEANAARGNPLSVTGRKLFEMEKEGIKISDEARKDAYLISLGIIPGAIAERQLSEADYIIRSEKAIRELHPDWTDKQVIDFARSKYKLIDRRESKGKQPANPTAESSEKKEPEKKKDGEPSKIPTLKWNGAGWDEKK